MAAETKTRGRVCQQKEIFLWLEKCRDENIQLQLKSCAWKKPIWLEIAPHLRAAGYEDRDDGSFKTRIHTLISAYRSNKNECAKTGNATPKKKPAFFDEVDELLSSVVVSSCCSVWTVWSLIKPGFIKRCLIRHVLLVWTDHKTIWQTI